MTLSELTETMTNNVGEKGALDGKIVLFDFGEDGVIRIDGTGEEPVVDNLAGVANCTIIVSLDNYARIVSGDLNSQMAFLSGKLKVDGEMAIAMQLDSLLG